MENTNNSVQKRGIRTPGVILATLVCVAGAGAVFVTVNIIRALHHEAFHEAGVGVSPDALTRLWANDTFAAGTEIVSAVLLLCLTFLLARGTARLFARKSHG